MRGDMLHCMVQAGVTVNARREEETVLMLVFWSDSLETLASAMRAYGVRV